MNGANADARSVAVVGMACRLPGARDIDEFWQLLCNRTDATADSSPDRYDADFLNSPKAEPGTTGSRRAGYVDGLADFDAEFFGMSSSDAAELDPQQRLLLMTAWDALEEAGLRPDRLAGTRTGVFVGATRADFVERAFRHGPQAMTAVQYLNFRSVIPAQVSYAFDFRGPSMLIDTACASSLYAVHSAVQSLRVRESSLALAAGVNLVLRPDEGIMMGHAGTLSPDGRSRFGDARADGHAPSDGVGVVVLKRLADAIADGDRVHAVIAGSAVGTDGRTTDQLLNPSLTGQLDVLRWAYEDAGVDPSEVDYVEAHGTGSPLLDPLELRALGEVLGEGRPDHRPLLVGSAKSNIGHAEAAGGMAGLIKTVLCLRNGRIPASLHVDEPTPDVDWKRLPVRIPVDLHDLPSSDRPALAGVSSQGVSALNAHVVLRQADRPLGRPSLEPASDTPYVLALSARSPEALLDLAAAYVTYLGAGGRGAAYDLRDICYSATARRTHHVHRLAVVGASHEELAGALAAERAPGHGRTGVPAPLVAATEHYLAGEEVHWEALFDEPGTVVPLPRYPWQTRRYWPGEDRAAGAESAADWLLREHARTDFDDASRLSDIGIDSLARLQLIVELSQQTGLEIDPEEVGRLCTVGELRLWTDSLQVGAR
ncbi:MULTISPECIES: beta-ketoacyl synthase N-terminal-like domain-containing protein [unclassified Streptomyces]|uniref:beta-ketoacyl synthase N-terminal-like domain-containing protein n=1 Tax=unclassified Streptomyces TaxID=2593676 RepID=UPI00165537B5|nr:beta-ketoacyl synthase N-terminal-like domain-containing protein [Streptomyces sp. CB02980]MCB8901034.1 phosphopantetheine-binding protein [Streptomyces sp. CB02980]